ncbi:MAG TPA: hypothetical protein PKX03_01480, partial [Candidatus Paceibacterota bacterium]|nr:hypothetical protein [Candidatus Paceibacterota bacterium]
FFILEGQGIFHPPIGGQACLPVGRPAFGRQGLKPACREAGIPSKAVSFHCHSERSEESHAMQIRLFNSITSGYVRSPSVLTH